MEKNTDRKVVVLDTWQFQRLMRLAQIGASECGELDSASAVLRHAIKFNPDLARDRKQELRERADDLAWDKRQLRRLRRMMTNKTVMSYTNVDGAASVNKKPRTYYHLDHTSSTAVPVYLTSVFDIKRLQVKFDFAEPDTDARDLDYRRVSHIKNIMETREEVPSAFEIVEGKTE